VLLKKTAVHVIAVMGKKKLVFFELYGKKYTTINERELKKKYDNLKLKKVR